MSDHDEDPDDEEIEVEWPTNASMGIHGMHWVIDWSDGKTVERPPDEDLREYIVGLRRKAGEMEQRALAAEAILWGR